MGVLDKILGDKKKENQDQQKTDTFWSETKYGYAPKDAIKVHFSPERDVYPKYPSQGDEGFTFAASWLEDIHQKLKHLDSKTYNNIEFLRGICPICDNNYIIPKSKEPIFFKCPFCSTSVEKVLIELLLFLNPNNEIFGNCPNCNKYSYLKVSEDSRYINFNCKGCNIDFILNKDHPIELTNYSDRSIINWCSACGNLFEGPLGDNTQINCPRCETNLEPNK
jgi:hypothetical protein